ncbi:hypothetical protein RB653_001202 [Dictyostelium firmibasis]|uniref:Uncharacterized protein n=1 Tax=Dictyostelium firmibasis TaxID=79012 RepID=A0AAN7U3M1_9MYCE
MTSFLFLGLIDRSGCFTFYIYYFEYDINGNFLFLATELPSFCFVSYYSGISYFFPNETASVDQPQSLAQRVISLFIGLIELIFSVISSIYFVLLKFNDSYISTNQLFANTNDADFQVDHRLKYLGISLLGSGVFFSRGIVTIISIFIVIDHSGLKDLFYYFFSEIVPIFVTLYYMEEIQNLTGRSANEGRALLGENRT